MGETTGIAWADSTFNPWIGCTKVSPGCDHCYAEALDRRHRWGGAEHWGPGVPRRRTADSTWAQPRRWNAHAKASGKPWRVFCASLADVFDNEVPDEWRSDLWKLIAVTPALTWMLLTKRIGNVERMFPVGLPPHVWERIWLGITVVNQEEANRDIPKLLEIPARVRWLSIEPQIERIDLCETFGMWWNQTMSCFEGVSDMPINNRHGQGGIDWVITGGESGPGSRPYDVAWARALVRQCRAARVPVFVKQLGAYPIDDSLPRGEGLEFTNGSTSRPIRLTKHVAGAEPAEWPEDLRVREFPA